MEEERIKSALEIAMERISGLPQLTPEEIAAQREKDYRPLGEAICHKYLEGIITADDLPAELGRHRDEAGRIVRRSLIRSLCASMSLEDARKSNAALAGIISFAGNKMDSAEEMGESLRQILNEFEREKQDKSREFEILARAEMEKLGISGSSVRPNLNENKDWQRVLGEIRKIYDPKLEKLRDGLLKASES